MRRVMMVAILVAVLVAVWIAFRPPRAWLNATKAVEPTIEVGSELVDHYECRECHRITGSGGLLAPDLAGITRQAGDPALVTLRLWLLNPKAVKGSTAMPNFHLSDSEIDAILAYLTEVDQALALPE